MVEVKVPPAGKPMEARVRESMASARNAAKSRNKAQHSEAASSSVDGITFERMVQLPEESIEGSLGAGISSSRSHQRNLW